MKLKRLFIFFLIILLFGIFSYFYPHLTGEAVSSSSYEKEPAEVLRIVDGDTIETNLGTVRLLGINTPEKGKPYYEEAKQFLSQIENKTIFLLRDKEDIDKYQRLLRYVFYNNRNLNIEIVEKGLASVYMLSELEYKDKFLRAQKYAQEAGLGIWKKSTEKCAVEDCISLEKLNATSEPEYFTIKNNCAYECNLEGWFVKDAGRNTFKLLIIKASEEQTFESPSSKHIWNNDHDEFFMFDGSGKLVMYHSY